MEIRDLTKEAVLIQENSSFRDAIAMMVKRKTNSLLVIDDEGKLSGEISVSDLLNAIVPEYSDPDAIVEELGSEKGFGNAVKGAGDKLVSDFMSMDFQPVHVDDSLLVIASTAITHGTQHIPIVDHENRPIGVISRRGIKQILAKYLGIKDKDA
jgi:CBS domain-containing protein